MTIENTASHQIKFPSQEGILCVQRYVFRTPITSMEPGPVTHPSDLSRRYPCQNSDELGLDGAVVPELAPHKPRIRPHALRSCPVHRAYLATLELSWSYPASGIDSPIRRHLPVKPSISSSPRELDPGQQLRTSRPGLVLGIWNSRCIPTFYSQRTCRAVSSAEKCGVA